MKKVLIANRGEIAVRVIRACRELDIETVAVYSTADRSALHAQIADEAVCIGAPASKDSYLNMAAILTAALQTGADAIHPGFGFLSENPEFAEECGKHGIKFIGPDYKCISMLGDKAVAKATMKAAGVPVIPGSDGAVKSLAEAKTICEAIGYPVMIKAAAGGGGRGIRRVDTPEDLERQIVDAKREAKTYFGNDEMYIEKFIIKPKHIEFQVLADEHGNVVHLFERDCSMQRRNQKVLEETPSPVMTAELRERMGTAAVNAAKAAGYKNAGTIEFLLSGEEFYFMEMNTRIQVEHPITEMLTGIDLVQMQLKIAAGETLPFTQANIKASGASIECRINAEDPDKDFRPCPGTINALHIPGGPGVRIDSAVYQGYAIPPYYDSMIAKLIVHAPTRAEAIMRMRRSLAEFIVDGVKTNIDFQLSLITDPVFEKGDYDIAYLSEKMAEKMTGA
ncbi:MAG: acetyl-CoA carboxylase biotin carboxylase subunit [Ruminococcus sp.]|jgi:acetyl-CoA carboxylase biotin carboxylase subunit|nr:acetyl-CoA carboxylase biotin carboxylase subunit [Ruminococcus sp.]